MAENYISQFYTWATGNTITAARLNGNLSNIIDGLSGGAKAANLGKLLINSIEIISSAGGWTGVTIPVTKGGTGAITELLAQRNLFIGLGADGTDNGSGGTQATVAVPSGVKMALITIVGDYYNAVAGAHTGYWQGIYRAQGNTITVVSDILNSTGDNQGFTVAYSGGNLVVTNNQSLTANQSGIVRIIFM